MSRVLFCDWNDAPETSAQTTLFEIIDLSDFDVVFFDPLQFTANIGLRKNTSEIYKVEYYSYSEDKLRALVAGVKLAAEILSDFIIAGGILVIRSNFPKSYIKVTKDSIIGLISNKYTESIVSIFYWLEEFLGRFSCDYGKEYSFSYIAPRSRLYKAFGQSPAESMCAVTLNRSEYQSIIAESAHEPFHPLIYAVSGKHGLGEIYIIPKFLIPEESERLADVFSDIHKNKTSGIDYPFWVDRYEQKLNKVNPFNRQVIEIDREVEQLKRKRSITFEQSEDIRELLQLLYGSDEDLLYAVQKAFEIIGFQSPAVPETVKPAGFDLYLRSENAANICVDLYSSEKYAISAETYQKTAAKIEECLRDDKPKVIIVANAVNTVVPNKRVREFADEVIGANLSQGFGLLTSVKLFELACCVLENSNSPHLETMKESIRADIVNCHGEYESNPRKYLASTTV
ncbi:MAG: hypothetical protein KAR42_14315 [candidate division Zixibacteria bacterium]|nr:hypothetical protein [candidate division Zixibacteria bacterium]